MCYIGKVINHDDTIEEKDLKDHASKTKSAWEAHHKKLKEEYEEMKASEEVKASEEIKAEEIIKAKQIPTNNISSSSMPKGNKKGLKSKIKSIFSKRGKKEVHISTIDSPVIRNPACEGKSNDLLNAKGPVSWIYSNGTHEVLIHKHNSTEEIDDSLEDSKGEAENNLSTNDVDENKELEKTILATVDNRDNYQSKINKEERSATEYDITNISFHDRSNLISI